MPLLSAVALDAIWMQLILVDCEHSFSQHKHLLNEKVLKCKPSAEFDANIGIFGFKTPLHAYVLGEHTSMKN